MARTRGKRLKKKGLVENSPFGTIGVKKKSMKNKNKNMKKALLVLNTSLPSSSNARLTPTQVVASMKKKNKNKSKKKALLVLNTSLPSSSNLRLTPTQVVASTSLLVPSKKKEVNESKMKRREKNENKPGYIFMCNRRTKSECYRYRIFGLPRGKLEVVKNIEPGMKLFLYDFDLKFLYGVYEATSTGALDLEPSAFNGLFPAQVKFNILKDSLPLPESTFRHAIEDNYQGGNKFKQELSPIQVKSLISLFHDIVVTPSAPTVPFIPRAIAPPIVEEEASSPPLENPYFSRHRYVPTGPPLDTRTEQLVQLRECGPNEYRPYAAPPIVEEEARFHPSENPHFSRRHYVPMGPPLDTPTEQLVQLREGGPNGYRSYVTPPIVEEGARFPPSEDPYFSRRHYVPARPSLDTQTEQLVQHRERGPDGYRTYVAPRMMEEEARFPPSTNPYFSRRHYLATRPPHDTEMEQVVQHRECGLHEYQTYVAGLQPSVESKHVVQSEAVYHDKPYYLAEAYQPYVPENPRLLSPDPYKRNLTRMNPRDQDIGGHRTGSIYYSANLAGERKPISPITYVYSPARERQQPLHLVDYPRPPDYDYYGQHLHPTSSTVSVPAHDAHPQPDLQHLPPHRSYYTAQNPDLLHGGMTQRTVPVSYGDISGNILVSSRYTSAGVAPAYQ